MFEGQTDDAPCRTHLRHFCACFTDNHMPAIEYRFMLVTEGPTPWAGLYFTPCSMLCLGVPNHTQSTLDLLRDFCHRLLPVHLAQGTRATIVVNDRRGLLKKDFQPVLGRFALVV